jgi:DNA modification methylase
METLHQIYYQNSQSLAPLPDQSVDLVVTSPPYPMIEMWDDIFSKLDPQISRTLARSDGAQAFERMHAQLEIVWREVHRVLKPGGLACINIGDATRTVGDDFQLFANHTRIAHFLLSLGLKQLPAILWRKPTNSPNKFMGSGMLPPNAYVTLEHEYILIFRKKGIRRFTTDEEKELRRESAYFWEERNSWFSDVWFGLIGASQKMGKGSTRVRSGAYPFELAYRLILMFSVKGDTVLDPFLGTGTTLRAALCAGRGSIGFEIDPSFQTLLMDSLKILPRQSLELTQARIAAHQRFVQDRIDAGKPLKHFNASLNCPVITQQEKKMRLDVVERIDNLGPDHLKATLAPWQGRTPVSPSGQKPLEGPKASPKTPNRQLELF